LLALLRLSSHLLTVLIVRSLQQGEKRAWVHVTLERGLFAASLLVCAAAQPAAAAALAAVTTLADRAVV
jgi:hypothetical protein